MQDFLTATSSIIWGKALVFLCLFTGIYFSFKTRFMQIRLIKPMITLLFRSSSSQQGVSSFQSLMISLSGRIGTGNIAGTATAVYYGGPGSLFWMCAIAFFGAASAFVESTLAQLWKKEVNGEYRGGPPYYIEKGLGSRRGALIFSCVAMLSCGIFLPGVQSNAIAAAMSNGGGISPAITAVAVTAALIFIIYGGTKMLARASVIIVPVVTLAYIAVTAVIIIANIEKLPSVLAQILSSAFGSNAAFGGILGSAVSWGVKRGIYSNEAGQGTGAYAAAAAETSHPAKQGLVQAFSVYIDTLLICLSTGLMLLLTGCYNVAGKGEMLTENLQGIAPGPVYAQAAVSTVFPSFGAVFIAAALTLFAFTSLVALYYQSETNALYLFSKRGGGRLPVNILRPAFLVFVFISCISTPQYAWAMGDIGSGLLTWCNISVILLLQSPALWLLKDYEEQRRRGTDPFFTPDGTGINGAGLWRQINRNKNK